VPHALAQPVRAGLDGSPPAHRDGVHPCSSGSLHVLDAVQPAEHGERARRHPAADVRYVPPLLDIGASYVAEVDDASVDDLQPARRLIGRIGRPGLDVDVRGEPLVREIADAAVPHRDPAG
jgi:hypothetical protein